MTEKYVIITKFVSWVVNIYKILVNIYAELRNTQCFAFCPFLRNKHSYSSIAPIRTHIFRYDGEMEKINLLEKDWVLSPVSGFTPVM